MTNYFESLIASFKGDYDHAVRVTGIDKQTLKEYVEMKLPEIAESDLECLTSVFSYDQEEIDKISEEYADLYQNKISDIGYESLKPFIKTNSGYDERELLAY